MKNLKKIMLIALMVLMIIPIPQQASALERKAERKIERRERKPQRKPVNMRSMRDNDFSLVYKVVKNTSFDDKKIDIIRVACIGNCFSSKQCARLLSLLSFDENKIEALKIIAPRMIDNEYYKKIIKQFSFSSNKEKAEKILARQ